MSIFKKRSAKNTGGVVWRDADGKIRCLGDDCPQANCDDTCPIWLSTMASTLHKMGETEAALEDLKKASALAPDFYDVWNNMGAMHGELGRYQEAHDCYLKAHEILPEKKNPIFGLALSSRDLKLFDECINWCDKYDKMSNDHACDSARAVAVSALKGGSASEVISHTPMDFCFDMLREGKCEGFVFADDTFPNIPEIACQAGAVAVELFNGLSELILDKLFPLTMMWAVYAAMGAVRCWYDDWDGLKKSGIVSALTSPRGLDNMDEYVMDYVGWKWGSTKSEKFRKHIQLGAVNALNLLTNNGENDLEPAGYTNALQGMFYYGMIVEMNDLGMR